MYKSMIYFMHTPSVLGEGGEAATRTRMIVTEDKTDRKLGKIGYQHAPARDFRAT